MEEKILYTFNFLKGDPKLQLNNIIKDYLTYAETKKGKLTNKIFDERGFAVFEKEIKHIYREVDEVKAAED